MFTKYLKKKINIYIYKRANRVSFMFYIHVALVPFWALVSDQPVPSQYTRPRGNLPSVVAMVCEFLQSSAATSGRHSNR